MALSPIAYPANPEVILDRRAQILMSLLDMDDGFAQIPVRSIKAQTLDALLRLYDELFFENRLCRAYGELTVTLSSRLISAAGKFVYAKAASKRLGKAEIRMSSDFLTRLEYGPFSLNGLTAATPQEAFLFVFEHELCHALETAAFGSTGHSARFLQLANRFFGHTTTTHSLPTRKAEAAQNGIRVGMRVSFLYQGRTFAGTITYIGKTATVMVQSATGEYRDARGRRYTKYRVPLNQLIIK